MFGQKRFTPDTVTAERDAFGRFRVSSPETLFDSKLSTANHDIFWNFSQVSGTCTATYSQARASYTLAVSDTTAGLTIKKIA